jgi:copper chaperone CopZ
MKIILLSIAIILSVIAQGQVKSVSLQASGLTCSMCSNAINKALKTLDFIEKVNADIKTYTFEISFKPNSVIDFDLIRKSVEKAGFSVCAFIATVHFDDIAVQTNKPVIVENKTLVFLNNIGQVLHGDMQIKVRDKGFISAKEYKKNPLPVEYPQIYHVSL